MHRLATTQSQVLAASFPAVGEDLLRPPELSVTDRPGPLRGPNSVEPSFADLWASAEEQVEVFLRATVFSRDDRQDLQQSVAQKALAALSTYCPQQGSFLGWVLGIARNEYLHYVRARRRARVLFDSELADQAVAELCRTEQADVSAQQDALRQGLADLPAEQRELLRLKYVENLTCGEISERLGLKEDAVRMRLRRVRVALKENLLPVDGYGK